MMRVWKTLAGLLLAFGVLLAAPATAHADSDDDSIRDYRITANVDASGTTAVTLTLDFDFGSDSGHGPYLTFPLQQEIADDPDHWRMIDIEVVGANSPSGANAELQTQTEDGNLLVRVGNENQVFTGTQTYVIYYTIRGLIAPEQAQSGLDEFNWNAVGTGWEVPIDSAAVTVNGPVDVTSSACFTGYGLLDPCTAAHSAKESTFSTTGIGNGTGMQVVAGFPAGTFTGAEARIERRLTVWNMFPVTPITGGVTAALSALGLAALFRRTRRSKRDQVYLGLTPGVVPAANQEVSVGYDSQDAPVAVRFNPPDGARPGELGTLMDATADNSDITATVIDLAVRGHLQITQTGKKDWTFTRLDGRDELAGYESRLLSNLFSAGRSVTTDELKKTEHADVLTDARNDLHSRVAGELGWFTRNPATVRGLALAGGIALIVVGAGLGFLLGFLGWGLVGAAGVIVGLAVMALNNRFGSRTPNGSAVLAQTKGFELYLRTAEAEQIKFEEGIDVFSRYLPYAIMFGVAERWTKVFEELAASGRYTFDTYWYVGYGYGNGFNAHNFASSMNGLANTMSSSMQAATAATSGGSGFSGGGGFGGGGGGGW
ncbi:MAG TPA: DUF2207 domain-containing protein [Propionicimonas sp.]|nr:DUF2207 domain-containing protein [Propionicimonas sp.]HRA05338.1 DUF2207 domain-containing protein [Propionicimonas sp.]